jgi:hypothetical protein
MCFCHPSDLCFTKYKIYLEHPLVKLHLPLLESRCFKGRRGFDLLKKKSERRNEDMSRELADPGITFQIFAASPYLIKMDHLVRNIET